MPSVSPPESFWLLDEKTPKGPYTVGQLRDRLADGRATWGTKVCPVGGGGWRPLHQTLKLIPDDAPGGSAPPVEVIALPGGPVPPPARPAWGRRAAVAGAAVAVLAVGYLALRPMIVDALTGYTRGFGDTVVRYRDRSYDGAKWVKLKESDALANVGEPTPGGPAKLARVVGWDDDNYWVLTDAGRVYHHREGHWRFAGAPAGADLSAARPADADTLWLAGGTNGRLFEVSPAGTVDHGELGSVYTDNFTELFLPDRGLLYCYRGALPGWNKIGTLRLADAVRTEMPEDKYQEAVVHSETNAPLKEYPVRFLRHSRTTRAGGGLAVARNALRTDEFKLVIFRNGTWYAAADLPKRAPADVWVGGSADDPVVVLVAKDGWVHVRPPGGKPGADRVLVPPPEPTSLNLIAVWGTSADKFWTADDTGTVWEFGPADARVVVRGLRREDVTFKDVWASPTGAVYAVTDKHLYRLD